ncbi:methyl methanesulfonate sensitivity 4 [Musca autumnalis]|uniref:methyl methanesulfonate sensitivity 4 n=1 Tax=Musca autumnalis TaxID=221902 RepID=UPI003CEA3ADB
MDNKTEKLRKKNIRDQLKRMKPGECQKYVRLVIDCHIMSAPYGRELIAELNNAMGAGDLKYEIRNLPLKETIIWERSVGQLTLAFEQSNALSEEWQREKQVIKLLSQEELQQLIKYQNLGQIAENLTTRYANIQFIVAYLGRPDQKHSTSETNALLELQVMHQLHVLEIANYAKGLVGELKRLNKAIAEAPYKQQKSETMESFKKFLANDKKQCVRVEGTNGFGRLWQQHLNRLPLVTLEVAETIIERYPCPKQLMADLKNNPDAVKEIGDLKIKRSGPKALQTDRRIGNVLAFKLYMLYNSTDPNTLI